MAIDSSGIYITGVDRSPGDSQWRIEKRNLDDGSLLWVQTSNPSSGYDSAYEIAVDASGLYVVGWDHLLGDDRWRMEKRDPKDGSLIWVQTNNPGTLSDHALDVAVDSSGIYVVGVEYREVVSPGLREISPHLRVEKRSSTDGSLVWVETTSESAAAWAVDIDSSGIYLVGANVFLETAEWRIEKRSLTDGSLTWLQRSNPSPGYDAAFEIAVHATGIYLIGRDESPGDKQWRMEKRGLKDGSLVWVQTSNPSHGDDWVWDVVADDSGVYAVGEDLSQGDEQWRIEKRTLTDGSLVVEIYLEILTSYSSASESRWVEKGTQVTVSLEQIMVDHGNGTRRTFKGWYREGSLFSEDPNPSFEVEEPMTLVAEWATEQLRVAPPPEAAIAAVAVGTGASVGLTAAMSATGLSQRLDAIVSSLKLPDKAKEFLKLYSEEAFKQVTREEMLVRGQRRQISPETLLSLAFSALVLLVVFSYVEVNGLPRFTDLASLLTVVPHVLVTVVLFFVAKEVITSLLAAFLGVHCVFKVWLYGLVALIVSGFGLLLPFGSPGRTDYEGDLDVRKAALTATLKILCDLVLMLPFYAILALGYKIAGDAGLLIATMSAYYTSFPFRPLEGSAIYKYSKPMWAIVFLGSSFFFLSAALNLFPSIAYLLGGILAAVILVVVLAVAQRIETAPMGPLMPPPPPPPEMYAGLTHSAVSSEADSFPSARQALSL